MARTATIIGRATDIWGDRWAVRERRRKDDSPDVLLGWPEGADRGKGGAGGPRVIVTKAIAEHFERHRMAPSLLSLPIGSSAIKRVRRLLGHHRQIDAAAWWEERADDLADMTIEAFAAKHDCSVGGALNARHALLGPALRPPGWWRAEDVARIILDNRSHSDVADRLGISVGASRRLRSILARAHPRIRPA